MTYSSCGGYSCSGCGSSGYIGQSSRYSSASLPESAYSQGHKSDSSLYQIVQANF